MKFDLNAGAVLPEHGYGHIGIVFSFHDGVLNIAGIGFDLLADEVEQFLHTDYFVPVPVGFTFKPPDQVMTEYALSQTAVLQGNLTVFAGKEGGRSPFFRI